MMIDSPAAAVEFAGSWIAEASPHRARWHITSAIEGQDRRLAIEACERYSPETREQTRRTRRALVSALFYSEVTEVHPHQGTVDRWLRHFGMLASDQVPEALR